MSIEVDILEYTKRRIPKLPLAKPKENIANALPPVIQKNLIIFQQNSNSRRE